MRRIRGFPWVLLLLLMADEFCLAQLGGRYPGGGYPGGGYPGGGYPGGGYPGGGVGLPIPRRGKNKKTTAQQKKEESEPLTEITGMLRSMNERNIVIEANDTRILNLKRTDRTKFTREDEEIKASELKMGDQVTVEARQDEEGFFTAVNVMWQRSGSAADRIRASQEVQISRRSSGGRGDDDDERPILRRADSPPKEEAKEEAREESKGEQPAAPEPAPARDDSHVTLRDTAQPVADIEEDGRPRLRRGQPVLERKTAPESAGPPARKQAPVEIAAAAPPTEREREAPAARPEDVRIEKARGAAGEFTESLPNYVCQQFTARFVSVSHITSWQPQDVVSAEVVHENRRDTYRNLAINGKPTKKTIEELPGSWSTGEFGVLLADLFSPATNADFRYRRESRTSGREAYLYDYTVERENSHWRIEVGSQTVLPAYRGSVWIDKETSRVLRIEMQARNVPAEFPMDKIESALDYEFVRFADRQYLVPVHSESLSCHRGTNQCSRNVIDFRNYHKYSGESSIQFQK